MEINGKKVVVIGGASGFGRASAELLKEKGANVAILDREGTDGKEVAEGIGGKFYPSTSPTSRAPRRRWPVPSTISAACMSC